MISIPVDSDDIFSGKVMTKQGIEIGIKIGLWIVGGLCGIIAILIGVIYADVTSKLFRIDTAVSSISVSQNKQGELLARIEERSKFLDERTKSLEDRTKTLELASYKAKAVAAGFKNPQIVTTSLEKDKKFNSEIPSTSGTYFLTYTILGYDPIKKTLSLLINGRTPDVLIKDNIFLMHNVAPGVQHEVTGFSDPRIPRIFIQILDLPSHNQAIFAIGPKIDSSGKTS